MKIFPDKLAAHLDRGMAPIYLLHGEEPLGIMECGDRIRLAASQAGHAEREVIVAVDDADWSLLRSSADSLSLFAEKRLIELRIPSGKTGRQGAQALKEYATNAPEDIVLLITTTKLDRSQTSSAWYKAIDKVGVTMAFWPLRPNELPTWIESRMKARKLGATRAAIQLIAERVEGNMLAADQEVERLSLLFPEQELDVPQVLAAVANSARYSIGDCVDASMQGATARALRVLNGLNEEAVAPMLVLWALTQEIRSGTRVAESLAVGMKPEAALKAAGVWQNRVQPLKLALSRHTTRSWLSMLHLTTHADRVLKGQEPGDVWDVLRDLCVQLAQNGQHVMRAESV